MEVLAGGPNIGHREYTMSPDDAKRIWEEFLGFFDKNTRILYSVSLGSAGYVYSPGILIVDKDKAGVFNILAND